MIVNKSVYKEETQLTGPYERPQKWNNGMATLKMASTTNRYSII